MLDPACRIRPFFFIEREHGQATTRLTRSTATGGSNRALAASFDRDVKLRAFSSAFHATRCPPLPGVGLSDFALSRRDFGGSL
jgi:hypothetical protein